MKRLVALLIVGLSFVAAGCEEKWEDYYVFYLSARVVDEDGNPIQGILAYPEGDSFGGRMGYSNFKGEIFAFAHLAPRNSYVVIIEDVDGEANGGCYESQRIDVTSMLRAPSRPDRYGFTGSGQAELGDVVLRRLE